MKAEFRQITTIHFGVTSMTFQAGDIVELKSTYLDIDTREPMAVIQHHEDSVPVAVYWEQIQPIKEATKSGVTIPNSFTEVQKQELNEIMMNAIKAVHHTILDPTRPPYSRY